jgi:hypothetical protein
MSGAGCLAKFADRVDGDGATGILHVLLRAAFQPGTASEIVVHHLVGSLIDALLHHLRAVAAFEIHLNFPEARLARRQVERQGWSGEEQQAGNQDKRARHGWISIADRRRDVKRKATCGKRKSAGFPSAVKFVNDTKRLAADSVKRNH